MVRINLQISNYLKQRTTLIKIIYFPVTRIIVGIIVCLIVPYLTKEFLIKPVLESLITMKVAAKCIQHILSTIVIFATYYLLFKYYEKRTISEFSAKYMLKEIIAGFSGGFIVISLIIFILFLLGYYEILSINDFSVFLLPLITVILLALYEEIIYRGIIYRITENWIGTNLALIIPAVIFGISHIPNENATLLGIIGATFGGFLLSIMFTYTKRLWVPFSFHLGWNFSQLIYGSSLSGTDQLGSFFHSYREGPQLLTGSNFGIEDSIFALIVCLILFAIFYYKAWKKNEIVKPSWKLK